VKKFPLPRPWWSPFAPDKNSRHELEAYAGQPSHNDDNYPVNTCKTLLHHRSEVSDLCAVTTPCAAYWGTGFRNCHGQAHRGNRRYYQRHGRMMIRQIQCAAVRSGAFTMAVTVSATCRRLKPRKTSTHNKQLIRQTITELLKKFCRFLRTH